MIDLPEEYFNPDPALIDIQRQFNEMQNWLMAEMQNRFSVSPFPFSKREWPEIVYEDILDAEVLDD